MNSATDIIAAIANLSIPMTSEEIRTAWELLRLRNDRATRAAVRTFNKGDRVSFLSRSGEHIAGVVTKVNIKKVIVATPAGNWRVSASALTACEGEGA
jgi:hypothetical protein